MDSAVVAAKLDSNLVRRFCVAGR